MEWIGLKPEWVIFTNMEMKIFKINCDDNDGDFSDLHSIHFQKMNCNLQITTNEYIKYPCIH